jgi:sentrin-specific protease 1
MNGQQETPQQDNGSDCGVFSCQTLEAIARGRDLVAGEWEFGAENMAYFRNMMIYEIATGNLVKRW